MQKEHIVDLEEHIVDLEEYKQDPEKCIHDAGNADFIVITVDEIRVAILDNRPSKNLTGL